MGNSPKRHHYLPQCYLLGFSRDESVWVYDRTKRTIRLQKPVNTAVIGHFYSYENENGIKDPWVESELAKIDGLIPSLVNELRGGSLLSDERRWDLALVAAFLLCRVPDFHDMVDRVEGNVMATLLRNEFRTLEAAQNAIEEWRRENPESPDLDPVEAVEYVQNSNFGIKIHRNSSISAMLKMAPQFAEVIANLNVAVFHAKGRSSFITSDRPLAVTPPLRPNPLNTHYGSGILTEGALKFLPISSDMAIGFSNRGKNFAHASADQGTVRVINRAVAIYMDRFLIARDHALVDAWKRRLDLDNARKIHRMDLSANYSSDRDRSS